METYLILILGESGADGGVDVAFDAPGLVGEELVTVGIGGDTGTAGSAGRGAVVVLVDAAVGGLLLGGGGGPTGRTKLVEGISRSFEFFWSLFSTFCRRLARSARPA